MIVYCSMFMNIILFGCANKYYIHSRGLKTKYNNNTLLIFAAFALILPVFFIGLRTSFIDTGAFIIGFKSMPTDLKGLLKKIPDYKGPGWLVYEWIIKRFITKNANVFLLITAIIQAGALLKLYYKYSEDCIFSIFLFFLSGAFTNMMNGLRQFFAVTLILYFVDYIFRKEYLKFIIVALVAISIHNSAIIWLPAVFLVQGKPWNKKMILSSTLILLAVNFVDTFTDILEDALTNTLYEGITDQFANDDGSNIIRTFIMAVPVAIAFISRKRIAEIDDPKAGIMINISILTTMVSLLANFTSGVLMGRLPIYFEIFNFALLPWLFNNVFAENSKRIIRILCIIGYAGYGLYYMTHGWGSTGMPYVSTVLGIDTR